MGTCQGTPNPVAACNTDGRVSNRSLCCAGLRSDSEMSHDGVLSQHCFTGESCKWGCVVHFCITALSSVVHLSLIQDRVRGSLGCNLN